jgi:protease-4
MFKKESIFGIAVISLFLMAIILNLKPAPIEKESKSTQTLLFAKDGIAVLDLYGPIAFPQSSNAYMPMAADLTLEQLNDIRQDTHVKGLLIRINSPGGTVAASQEIYNAIKTIKAERNIPIVAQIGDVGASGAYYAALGADTIFANSGSLVGSIGVIIGNISIHKLAEKHGVDYNVYKSGPYKDLLSMWRPAREDEEQLLQHVIDDVYEQFKQAFKDSRKLSENQAKKLAQGQIYTGLQALDHNMIDKIGSYHDALNFVGEQANLGKNPHVIKKSHQGLKGFMSLLNSSFQIKLPYQLTNMPTLY